MSATIAARTLLARIGPTERLLIYAIGVNFVAGPEAIAEEVDYARVDPAYDRPGNVGTGPLDIAAGAHGEIPGAGGSPPDQDATSGFVIPANAVQSSSPSTPPATLEAKLPLVFEGQRLQPIPVRVTIHHLLGISPRDLSDSLGSVIEEDVRLALTDLGARLVDPAELAPMGINARLNPQTLSVEVDLAPSARRTNAIAANGDPALADFDLLRPSPYAAGLTVSALVIDGIDDARDATGQISLSGFANLGGIEGLNLVYGGTALLDADSRSFRRDAVTLFKDDTNRVLRYSAGDLIPTMPRTAGSSTILGLSVERSYQDLQPTRNIRPSGRRSFVLERRSTVEVYANEQLVTRFLAEAGAVDLSDIPLIATSNNIQIVVEDDFGRQEIDAFTLVNDLSLLSRGLSEYSLSLGLSRDQSAAGFEYGDDILAQGSYQRGLTDSLTLGGHVSASTTLTNAGLSVATAAPYGVAALEAAASSSQDSGSGFTTSLIYRAGPFLGVERNDLFTVRADYTSVDYANFNDLQSFQDIKLDIGADFRMDIAHGTSFSVSGGYLERHAISGADLFASVGVGRRIGAANLSVVANYSKSVSSSREDAGFLVSLTVPLGRRTSAATSYNSISETFRADAIRSRRTQVPDYSYRLSTINRAGASEYSGSVGYATSRFETDASIVSSSPRSGFNSAQTATLRLQSGIAFSDGVAGLSRDPSRGFYMFRKHPSLKTSTLEVSAGGADMKIADTKWLGPAVAPVRTPYRPEELRTTVRDAPLGYNIGPGRYRFFPGARTGTSVMVGQDAFRTLVGSVLFDGNPVSLGYGRLRNLETGDETAFFTNRTGRTALSDLAPGSYEGTFDALDLRFNFEVKATDPTYINVGDIYAERIK